MNVLEGKVKLMYGDCLERMKELPDKSIDLVLTDPPYGINWVSGTRKLTKYNKIVNDNNLDFLEKYICACFDKLKDNSAMYCFL